jgi:predicted lipid-binding transport protein (Tim44 family)
MVSEGIPYADILILALIAGFILLRLRSVLGRQDGMDSADFLRRNAPARELDDETVIPPADKPQRPRAEEEEDAYAQRISDSGIKTVLADIRARDGGFSGDYFLKGAKAAFEMVFDGFAKGEKAPLKMLLSPELYKTFEAEIEARAGEGRKTETTLLSVAAKDIIRATLSGTVARLTVHYQSEQVTVVRDASGAIIEGDPSDVAQVEDEWTFERDLTSKSPNWTIIDT